MRSKLKTHKSDPNVSFHEISQAEIELNDEETQSPSIESQEIKFKDNKTAAYSSQLMSLQKQATCQSLLDTMSHENHSIRAEIMRLSAKNLPIFGNLGNYVLLLLDYIQLLSPILLLSLTFQTDQETSLPNVILYFSRFVNPASWLFFIQIGNLEIVVISLVGIVTILKYLLLGYIALVAAGKFTPFPPLVYTWRLIFHIQARFIYFVTSSFWISTMILTKSTRQEITSSRYYGIMCTGGLMIALEFIFSLYLSICYIDILPSKKVLSAKDNIVETITLIQKMFIQFSALVLDFNLLSALWIFSSVNFLADILRNLYYFGTLPFYNFKTLGYQAILLMIVTALNIAYLTETVIKATGEASTHFTRLILIWIILSLLLIKISLGYLEKRFWEILLKPSMNSPILLIHRICFIEQIRNMTIPLNEYHEKNSWTLLVNNTLNVKIKDILKLDDAENCSTSLLDLNNRDLYNQTIQNYLFKLLKLFPKNRFIQLCIAQFYLKKLRLTQYPTPILYKLRSSSNPTVFLNAELLLMKVQNLLKNKKMNDKADLDLQKFLNEKAIYARAKQKVLQQTSLQIKICEEIKKESPNLALIFKDSQILAIHRQKTIRALHAMLNKISDHHIDPLLFCARYHLTLNNSLEENMQYTKLYSQKLLKYQKYFDHDTLVEENIYGNDVGITIFSETEPTVGKVVYVSPSFSKKLGQDGEMILSMNILKNSPPCLQGVYRAFHRLTAEKGEKLLPNQIGRAFLCHKEGYLIEIDYYMNLHPFISSEFYVCMVQRPVISNREFMYVLENGDIDSITQRLGERLNIKPTRSGSSPGTGSNLKDISLEIAMINEAFNMVFHAENSDAKGREAKEKQDFCLTLEEAKEIYSVCSTSGKDVILKSTAKVQGYEPSFFSYNLKISNAFLGKDLIKLFTLAETFQKARTTQTPNELETPQCQAEESFGYEAIGDETTPQKVPDSAGQENDCIADFQAMGPRISISGEKTRRDSDYDTSRCRETQRDLLATSRGENGQKKTSIRHKYSDSTGGRNVKIIKGKNNANKEISVGTSKWSKFSQQKRICNLYKISLNTKYYQRVFQVLTVLFFLVFLTLLITQAVLKNTLDNNVQDLSSKKDLLRCAQARTFQLINLQAVIRILWDLKEGALLPSAFGFMTPAIYVYPILVGFYISELSAVNSQLLLNTTSLDDNTRQNFFVHDVRVYDTYFGVTPEVYSNLDNFQATNRIVDAGLEIYNDGGVSGSDNEQFVEFILRNTLNDLLIKNQELSDLLVTSLRNQRDLIDRNILGYLVELIAVFVAFFIIFMIHLWKQYLRAATGLSAVCRLNPTKLGDLHSTFINFKKAIETEENGKVYNHNNTSTILSPNKLKKNFTINRSDPFAKREYKTPNHLQLRKECLITMGKFFILTGLILGLVAVSSAMNRKHIKNTQDMQTQIFALDHAKSRVSIAAGAFLELTSTNNTSKAENAFVLDKLEELADELGTITRDLYANFIETDKTIQDYEVIQATLIGEACLQMTSMFKPQCEALPSKGFKPGLVYILTSYATLIKRQIDKYKVSDKSQASLDALGNQAFETSALFYLVSTSELDMLAFAINENFEQEINNTRQQRIQIMAIYYVFAIVIGFILWKSIMVRLREGVNKFKNVLAVFPADMVLASFILRSFLMKTSNGVLNAIKNDIS